MLDVTCIFKGTLLMLFLSSLNIKGRVSAKCQHLLRCCISEYSLVNHGYLTFQAREVRTERWKNTSQAAQHPWSWLSCGSSPSFTRDLSDTSPADKKERVKFNMQRWDLFLNFKMPTCFAMLGKEGNV